jgi:hypothetical protein
MKHVHTVLAAVVIALAPALASAQNGPAGNWEVTLVTPQGPQTINLTLNQEGTNLTGDLASPMGTVPVTGTANDDAVALTAKIEAMGLELGLNGKVAGDTIDGTVKFGDFGEFPFSGKRAAAPPPAAAAAPATPAGPITDLNGKWDVKLIIAGAGEFPAIATLKQEGEKVSGILSSIAGEVAVNGTVTGRSLKLDFTAETPQGSLPVTMTGDMGDTSIVGKANIAGLGEADWSATRAAVQ